MELNKLSSRLVPHSPIDDQKLDRTGHFKDILKYVPKVSTLRYVKSVFLSMSPKVSVQRSFMAVSGKNSFGSGGKIWNQTAGLHDNAPFYRSKVVSV